MATITDISGNPLGGPPDGLTKVMAAYWRILDKERYAATASPIESTAFRRAFFAGLGFMHGLTSNLARSLESEYDTLAEAGATDEDMFFLTAGSITIRHFRESMAALENQIRADGAVAGIDVDGIMGEEPTDGDKVNQ